MFAVVLSQPGTSSQKSCLRRPQQSCGASSQCDSDALPSGGRRARCGRQVGYADQAHLNRSLKRFIGQTPSQIADSARGR